MSASSPAPSIAPVDGSIANGSPRVAPSGVSALVGGLLLALAAGALFFQDLGRHPLLDVDEARAAEVAREMATGHGIARLFLPTLDLAPYREKPAAYYWLVVLAYRLAGVDEWAARAATATAALAAVLAVYAYGARRGVAAGLGAGVVAATTAGWYALARYGTLDMVLTACVVAGVLSGFAWLEEKPPRRPLLVSWVAAALGALVKGPLAFLLVGGPIALAALVTPSRPTLAELGLRRGLVVAAAIVAAVWLPVAAFDPTYVAYFAHSNVRRLGAGSPHAAPMYYYVVWLPVLALPWALVAGPAVVRAARDPVNRPLLLWAAFVPALLTIPRGKLATYGISALAPFALLAGSALADVASGRARDDDRPLRVVGWATLAFLAALVVAALLAGWRYPIPIATHVLIALVAAAWTLVVALLLRRRRAALVPAAVLGATLTLYPLAVRLVLPPLAVLHSAREEARLVAAASSGPVPVIVFGGRVPSLAFYLGRPVMHTDDVGVVRDLFAGDEPVFLVTGRRHFQEIEDALGDRAHRWHGTVRRRLYANRPPPADAQPRAGNGST